MSTQPPHDFIETEDRVPPYQLPDPLRLNSGEAVASAQEWPVRRAEILRMFEHHMYGKTPAEEAKLEFKTLFENPDSFSRLASAKEVEITAIRGGASLKFWLLLYVPKQTDRPAPVFFSLNFVGNHAITEDPQVRISTSWMPGLDDPARSGSPAPRGVEASRWPIRNILSRGYGLATVYYGDLDPDFDDGFQNGVHPLFYKPGQSRPGPAEWGSIGAWAWGASRALDYLQTDPLVDPRRVAVLGHSRLGKTALWAAAQDERFAMAISNNSGCGGAALSRRKFGETVRLINERFPHWFCDNFKQYNDNEAAMPFDQHMLVALVAPRPVYIASAQDDLWADPRGEFLSGLAASPVYKLLGSDGMAALEMPGIEQPIMSTIGYHIRRGGHNITGYDWDRFMDFAGMHMAA
jgi:hypothetical protein